MTNKQRHFDSDSGFAVTPKFAEDLGKLFTPPEPAPTHIDRAIAEAARRHFAKPSRRLWWLRWTVPATAAAAVVLACVWWIGPDSRQTPSAQATIAAEDIDRNGKVDILDAFQLAKHIEAGLPTEKLWDLNGDGVVNRQDVDTVALAAVRLKKGV